jgi:hypothetical protein
LARCLLYLNASPQAFSQALKSLKDKFSLGSTARSPQQRRIGVFT